MKNLKDAAKQLKEIRQMISDICKEFEQTKNPASN